MELPQLSVTHPQSLGPHPLLWHCGAWHVPFWHVVLPKQGHTTVLPHPSFCGPHVPFAQTFVFGWHTHCPL